MKILLADNHDLVIEALAYNITDTYTDVIIYKAGNGKEALELAVEHLPDLIISDYKMEMLNGLELLVRIRELQVPARFIVISMVSEAAVVETLIQHGVDGYLNKESPLEEMLRGISEVLQGRPYLCRFTQEILKAARRSRQQEIILSRRELEVLKMIAGEMKNQEIARKLNIHVSTVETHKKNLIRKLGVKSSIGLVKYALEHKLFD